MFYINYSHNPVTYTIIKEHTLFSAKISDHFTKSAMQWMLKIAWKCVKCKYVSVK